MRRFGQIGEIADAGGGERIAKGVCGNAGNREIPVVARRRRTGDRDDVAVDETMRCHGRGGERSNAGKRGDGLRQIGA